MKFHVVNLGCKVNSVESSSIVAGLLDKGYENVDMNEADIIIVNTCTVTSVADKKSRKSVRQALKNASAKI